jgi:uncharacterized protein YabE (DUF348 family)
MKLIPWMVFISAFLLFACQPASSPTVFILEDGRVTALHTDERVPSAILAQAGITLRSNDRLLLNGLPIEPNSPISRPPGSTPPVSNSPITLQIRRAVTVTLSSPQGKQTIQTSAFTVGEALGEVGIQLSVNDKVDPPLRSAISSLQSSNSPILISPSRSLTITADGIQWQITSSARTVGEALAEAGIPLLGLDYSLPAETEALPSDGQIKVVRVRESVLVAQKPIPFGSELIASADVPLDQTELLQPGESGLTVQRIRIRYEDGEEISRTTEDESLVRPPKDRVLGYGTKIEIKTAVVDGVTIEYWRAVRMYATSYSPCRLGTGACSSRTASGKQLQKGMVALRTDLFRSLRGQPLYIPGYGYATVEDACGGCSGQWIDLGYSDEDYVGWHHWVTVYFLTPVPSNVIYILE